MSRRIRRTPRRWTGTGWHAPVLVLAVLVQGAVALWLGSRGWFSGDLIHYYVERGGAPGGDEGLMEPHAAHWQVLLIIGYLVMFKVLGLTSYLPYLAVTVIVHLALVLLSHRLLLRAGAHPTAALLAALALLTYGAGSEAFLVEAPVALTSAMLIALVSISVLLRRDFDSRGLALVAVLLLVAVMVSLGGVVAAVWVGFFALSRGVRAMAAVVLVPAAAFLVWYAVWGRTAARVLLSPSEALEVPGAALALLVAPFDDLTGRWGAGPVLVLAVLGATVWGARRRPLLASLALAGFAAAAFHAVLSAVAQVPYGMEQVTTSRYRYVVLVALLAGLALLLDAVVTALRDALGPPQRRVAVLLGAAAASLLLVHAALGQFTAARSLAEIGDKTRQHLAGTLVATSTGQEVINDAVRGSYISGEDLGQLADPALRSELPAFEASAEDRIEAESNYFVAVSDEDLDLGDPGEVDSDSFDRELRAGTGCLGYNATNDTPTLTVSSLVGADIRVRSEAGNITTRLHRPDEDVEGDLVAWRTEPGEWTYIGTTAQVAELDVTFDTGGRFIICFS
ncbi:MAG: hypothetical protein AVDCRST_MAG32-474 [uncultured Nocardioides sp.]|uniref:Glycosyltransferase RgtA/B/C/D-like domain-containing protein n=1 Tax=uncultured Nocardioides sp. TaxID=198441 RepID=A0A6J4MUQ6_9ACTN|nr:MAG: hypothetical protein AVDCRST_MAG32-474 [uncultured Nocardioides sp.]